MQAPVHSSATVEAALYRAGRALLALDVGTVWPSGFRSSMPEMLREAIVAYGHVRATFRVSPPSSSEISAMDQACSWLGLLPGDKHGVILRRVVGARMLVDPRTDRPLYSWRRLGAAIGCSHVHAKTLWLEATTAIARRLDAPGLCAASGGRVGPSRRVVWSEVGRAVRAAERELAG